MTLFTLVKTPKVLIIRLLIFIGITAFIALFGYVYEQLSHGVDSNYMWFAWIWVLGFGVIPYFLILVLPIKRMPGVITESIYNLGVAMITTRSIFIGVMEIYGKTNEKMVTTYTILSILLLISGLFMFIVGSLIPIKEETKA